MRPLTLHSVLVATSLSAKDLSAVRTAISLARLAGATLHVVHAGVNDETTQAALAEHIREADPSCDPLPEMTVRKGKAERLIVEVAGMVDADVIVLGPHRADQPHAPGGTAYHVAAAAGRPCLILPGEMKLPLGRVLVPIDASGAARGALAVGMTWASALRRRVGPGSEEGTVLVVMHVESGPDVDNASADILDEAMAAVSERVSDVAGVRVERVTDIGIDAAGAILARAADSAFDLVAVGTRADTHEQAELGSVSSAVVRFAPCPVLLVPPRVWRDHGGEPL
jgi:nucleotide-binding universal stress UspA family protein